MKGKNESGRADERRRPDATEAAAPQAVSGFGNLIHLNDVELPGRHGKRVHPKTIWKWARFGINARSGARIYLETEFIGGRIYTSADALDRFFLAKDDVAFPVYTPNETKEMARFRRQSEESLKLLRSRGVKC